MLSGVWLVAKKSCCFMSSILFCLLGMAEGCAMGRGLGREGAFVEANVVVEVVDGSPIPAALGEGMALGVAEGFEGGVAVVVGEGASVDQSAASSAAASVG